MSVITKLLRELADRGHKTTITAQLTEDESNELSIRFMCNDSPNRFGLNLRVGDINDLTDHHFERALEALVRRAKELSQ